MNIRRQWIISLAAALVITLLAGAGTIRRIDSWMQDWLYQRPGVTSDDIIIIGIDDAAFDVLGPYNTWDRNIMAAAIEMLASDPDNRPAATAVDVLYAGSTSGSADKRLAEAADALGNVVTASLAEYGEEVTWENGHAASLDRSAVIQYEQPYDGLRDASVQGHINAMYDTDGVMRHALLYVEPDGNRIYSMAYEAYRLYAEAHGIECKEPSVNHKGFFYVPFTGRPGSYYDGVSIAHLLEGKVPPEYWAGKIVLIGPYAAALQDSYFTPIDKGAPMYGVEFQANVIQSLLEGSSKRELSDPLQLVVLFLLCLLIMMLHFRLSLRNSGLLCIGFVVLGFAGAYILYKAGYVTHLLWLPFASGVLLLLAVIIQYIRTAKERQLLALEKERIGAELAVASRIQLNSLPKEFPPFPEYREFDIYASMTPAKEVGGDLYDFFLIDDDHLGMVIGDASGKGVPAALFMMVATSLLRNASMSGLGPAEALRSVNQQLCYRNPEEMFVTVWLGILEISTGKLTASNAGHEYPAIRQPDGEFELLKDKHSLVIGAMSRTVYREYEIHLKPGAQLFVYTDGVAEAINAQEQMYGTDRMLHALQVCTDTAPEALLESVSSDLRRFVDDAAQFDDLTMLCLRYNGAANPSECN